MGPRLARALHVALAAATEPCRVDVGAVVPAALAFGMFTGRDLDLHRGVLRLPDGGARGNEHEAQRLAQPRQSLIHGTGSGDIKFSRERRADFLLLALLLDALRRQLAELAHAAPGRDDR